MKLAVPLDTDVIRAFGQKWGISDLSLFGSVLRDDFRPDSDLDVLISLRPQVSIGLLEHV
jgi:predicted nucleotidyltransferase